MRPILPVLTAAAVVFGTALAQNPILLNGQIWDGNGGPLAAGVVYHVVGGPGSCGISVPTGQTLTIQPGAIVKIAGCFLVSGTLDAIGTAIAFLECDGLIVPSARWPCENLVIFTDNQLLAGRRALLELVGSEEFDWQSWARQNILGTA